MDSRSASRSVGSGGVADVDVLVATSVGIVVAPNIPGADAIALSAGGEGGAPREES